MGDGWPRSLGSYYDGHIGFPAQGLVRSPVQLAPLTYLGLVGAVVAVVEVARM